MCKITRVSKRSFYSRRLTARSQCSRPEPCCQAGLRGSGAAPFRLQLGLVSNCVFSPVATSSNFFPASPGSQRRVLWVEMGKAVSGMPAWDCFVFLCERRKTFQAHAYFSPQEAASGQGSPPLGYVIPSLGHSL